MRGPHAGRQAFAADVTERKDHTCAHCIDGEEIAGQMPNGENLAGYLEVAIMDQTRGAQPPVHLRCFEDFSVQIGVILLQRCNFHLQVYPSRPGGNSSLGWTSLKVDCTLRSQSAIECRLTHKALSLSHELVTAAVNRKYEVWLLRIWFQLLPEVDDMRIDCARIRIVIVTPNRIQQPVAAECFRGMGNEVGEQRKFLC